MSRADSVNPHFPSHLIIAGVHRSGTTTLFNRLAAHPQVSASRVKETNYFLPARYGRELEPATKYEGYFQSPSAAALTVEASPGYYCGGQPVIRAIQDSVPDTKILVLLREPVGRLESFYTFMKSILAIPREMSLETYVDRCLALTPSELASKDLDMYRGLHDGLYADYYEPWRAAFGDRLRFFFLDSLIEHPSEMLNEVARWTGLEPGPLLRDLAQENRRSDYRLESLQRYALRFNATYEPWLRKHPRVKQALRGAYRLVNGSPPAATVDEQLDADRGAELMGFYRDSNLRLAGFLGRDEPDVLQPSWLQNA